MIRATAPGKVVLWGEYGVLAGAPALVMAVDRYAVCELEADGDGWHFSASGFAGAAETIPLVRLFAPDPPPADAVWRLAWHVLEGLDRARLPSGGRVSCDTSSFQQNATKLGIGSSAALCTAMHAAFAQLLGPAPSYAAALEAHRNFQGGAGSGLDVAAAWHGGVSKFRSPQGSDPGEVTPWALPTGMITAFVFTGGAASTTDHLQRFARWRASGEARELRDLAEATEALFESDDIMQALADYVEALSALDRAAHLGIFSPPHRRLERLAFDAGVVYKPCGAGGGDIGAAFSPDSAALERFTRAAADNGFLPIALETAPHGIEVTG